MISQEIFTNLEGGVSRYGLSDAQVMELMREAHKMGLKVWFVIRTPLDKMYKEEREGAFLFELNPEKFKGLSREAKENFKENFEQIVIKWAKTCEEEGIELFTPISAGQLYLVFRDEDAFYWTNSLVEKVRNYYSGELAQKIDLNPQTAQLDFLDDKSAYNFSGFNFSGYDYISTDVFTTGSPVSSSGSVSTYQEFRELIKWLVNITTYFKEKYHAKGIIFGPEIMPPEPSEEMLKRGTEFWGHGNLSEEEMEENKVKLYKIIFEESYGKVDGYSFWSWMPGDMITQFEVKRVRNGEEYTDRIIAGKQKDGPFKMVKFYYTITLPEIRGVVIHDKEGIKIAKEIGANWVCINHWVEIDWDTGEILPEEEVIGRGSKLEDVRKRIREAKALGLKVLLQVYPEYWIKGKSPEADTHGIEGEHGPFPNQEEFLRNATEFVLEIAKFAEDEKVDMLSPWCEMNIFVDWNHSKKWAREILPKIKEIYHGEILYPKGELVWKKYGLEPEGDLSFWNFSGYDYVSADVFDNVYFFDEEYSRYSQGYESYRWFLRQLVRFLEELNERDKTKGIILGSEIGLPEQFLSEEVKRGKSIEEVVKNVWEILFEETSGRVKGYFFFPWRGKHTIPTDPPISFEADFAEFLKEYYKYGRFHEIKCDDSNPCTYDFYNLDERKCEHLKRNGNIAGCSGKWECGFLTCVNGECKHVVENVSKCCDDGDPETEDLWDEERGCIHLIKTCGIIFEDDFITFDKWEAEDGWKIEDGKAIGTKHGFLRNKKTMKDFSLKMKFKISEGAIHVGFRESVNGERYFVNLEKSGISLLKSIKKGNELQHLSITSEPADIGEEWRTVQIVAKDNKIRVLLNGDQKIFYEDRNPYLEGSIHIEACCDNVKVYVDYIKVENLC